MSPLRILTADDVRRALPMSETIASQKQAFAELSSGSAEMPLRTRVPVDEQATGIFMPAYLSESAAFGIKIVTVFPQNPAQGLPLIHAAVMVLDAATGRPQALLEGSTLTAIRTGAGAGAATDLLARADASTVAIIGSGVQARTQLTAVCTVRPIDRVIVSSPTRANAIAFAEEMAGRDGVPATIEVMADVASAVSQADIICTATTASTPVFPGKRLRPGTHVNGVGSYLPSMQEVDLDTIQRALVVVDSREAVLAEAGDLIIPIQDGAIGVDHIHAELGELCAEMMPGRTSDSQITYFRSVGVAVQDAAAAALALRNADKFGLGTLVDF